MSALKLPLGDSSKQLANLVRMISQHAVLLFVLLLALIYGFVLHDINNYSNVQPSPTAIDQQVKSIATPNIDQTVVSQLQNLQDNSVNVKTLFSQARSNPFQE